MIRAMTVTSVSTVLALCLTAAAQASGGYSSGGSYSGNYGSSESEKKVDQAYENGKAIFQGRVQGKAVSYCITKDEKTVPVKRSTIKQLKGGKYADVGNRLYNCEDPQQTMKSLLSDYQLNSVAYYLNKRYRLRLSRS